MERGLTKILNNLDLLKDRVNQDLCMLQYPPKDWVKPRVAPGGKPIKDVVVIGGGMCGLVANFALLKAGIKNIRTFDLQEKGREGPWVNYARMETLRSPKTLAGPALGIPSLTFQSWYETQWGKESWEALGKIPTLMWMDYLIWYRKVLNLNIENETEVINITPLTHSFEITTKHKGITELVYARKIVLATGREGMAEPRVPKPLEPFRGDCCKHSSEEIDFQSMAGKDIGVIGISASAVDNAASALEAGANNVFLFVRSPTIPRINKMKSAGYPGFTHGFPALPIADRLSVLSYVFKYRIAPPRDSVLRVWQHSNVHLCLDSEINKAEKSGEKMHIFTNSEKYVLDNIILGTGFKINVTSPKYLSKFSDKIRTFRDTISAQEQYFDEFLDFPDLGNSFQLQEKSIGEAEYLKDLHEFTFAATVSHGNVSGDIPAVTDGAERLARSIASDIFVEDYPHHFSELCDYEEPELFGDEIPQNKYWLPDV
jgi:cation diffusion facilitator CzcD-associated flavoprotein CzcO